MEAIEKGISTETTKDRFLAVEEKIKERNQKLTNAPVKSTKKYTLKSTIEKEVKKIEIFLGNIPIRPECL